MSGARPLSLCLAALLCAAAPAFAQSSTVPATSSAEDLAPTTTATTMVATVDVPGATGLLCALDAAPPAACTSPVTYAGLPDGLHVLRLRPVTAGVPGPEEALYWRVDTTGPTGLGIISPQIGATLTSGEVLLSWTAVQDASLGLDRVREGFEYRVDDAPPARVSPDLGDLGAPGNRSVLLRGVADGEHTWSVRAIDALGNASATVAGRFTVAAPPTALLPAASGPVLSSRTVVFDASGSLDNGPDPLRFAWDLDGDGVFETFTGSEPRIARRFTAGRHRVGLRVTDPGGLDDTTGATVTVLPAPPAGRVGVSIAGGRRYVRSRDVALRLVWPAFARSVLVSGDGGFSPARTPALRPSVRWRMPAGPDGPRTVYVRFAQAGAGDRVYQDDVILDRAPPRVERIPVGATWTLSASDATAGVTHLQVTTAGRTGRWLPFGSREARAALPAASRVRVRDGAGNVSAWLALPERDPVVPDAGHGRPRRDRLDARVW